MVATPKISFSKLVFLFWNRRPVAIFSVATESIGYPERRVALKVLVPYVLELKKLAIMAELSTLHYPILTDNNWSRWSTQMRVVFRVQKVSSVVEGDSMVDASGKEEQKKDWKEKYDRALGLIHQCVDDANFEKIQDAATAREAWNILVCRHFGGEKVKKVRLQALKRQYEHMEMEDSDKVNEFFSRMRACGDKITDAMIIEKILRSMPVAFDHLFITIEETRDLEKLRIEELQSVFEAHEMRRNGRKKRDDQALKIQHISGDEKKKSNKWKGKSKDMKKWKKGTDDQEEKNSSTDKRNAPRKQYSKEEKKNMECFVCRKKGHLSYECWFNKNNQNKKGQNNEGHVVEEEESESEPINLMVATNTEDTGIAQNIWYVESGCSNHMTYNRNWLMNLDESKKSKVRVADNNTLNVEGTGTVKVKRKNGRGTLSSWGGDAQMEVYDKSKNLILKCARSGNQTFQVRLDVVETLQCLSSVKEDKNWRWHLRFGNLNFKDLQQLSSKEMVSELPKITQPSKECENCLIGKQTRRPFKKQLEPRSKERLKVVHSDVCGPIEPSTVTGNRYFVTFVDKFSRMVWVFFMKQKNEVLEIFNKFKKLTEKESERKIKLLITDGGGEYTSREFESLCQDNGIKHEVIAAYTPEHNGLAERHNRTIMNMARCMLKEKDVVRELWGEAVATAVHVLNRCPTKRLTNRVPHAAWSGKKTSVNHFKIFGSLAFCDVANQKRVKLDDKSKAMVFVGYHSTSAYRLFDLIRKRITISKDVVVLEDESWNWQSNQTSMRKSTTSMQIPLPEEEEEDGVTQTADNTEIADSVTNESRPRRHVVRPSRLTDYEVYSDAGIDEEGDIIHLALIAGSEILDVNKALAQPIWRAAMIEELRSIEKNKTWKLMDLPHGKKSIDLNPDGSVLKHKARLVAKGFLQKEGIDFTEVFAPAARLETIRIVVAIACFREWNLFALDVKSAFLHGCLEEEKGRENQVYKLDKALYGLRQAPRDWNKRTNAFFDSKGFDRCLVEHSLYVKTTKANNVLIVCLYVDDLLLTGSNLKELEEFKQLMQTEFDMTDMGELGYFLGMEFSKTSVGLLMHQRKYVKDILSKFMMDKCNEAETPLEVGKKLRINAEEEGVDGTRYKQLVGSLRFLCNNHPYIMFGVGLLSRFMSNPKKSHMTAAKRMMRYIKGTEDLGIMFQLGQKCEGLKLVGYSYADFGGDEDDKKSTSGSIFFIHGALVSWSSKKQNVIALSSCESEYVAGCHAVCQSIWLSEILKSLKVNTMDCVDLNLDNTSAINLAKNPISHGRSKHIDIKYHFLRDMVNKGKINLKHCRTELQLADIFTKSLNRERFNFLRTRIGVQSLKTLN
ncbi:hypothetical protein V8G54_028111 [Vigna mungo]|uniref:Uncharacterized protein n=1 Tax=Vigna mungo TaxID=3915 RepID=A0AAQ3MRR9_VIGMU